MRMVPLNDLEIGMVLGKSIYGLNNQLILGAGYRITPDIETKLSERGYTYVYIMEKGTEDVIPQDIISDEVKLHAMSKISNKADEIRSHLKFRDLSRTKVYKQLQSGYLKNVNITQDIKQIVSEVLSNIATVGKTFLNTMLFKTKDTYFMDHALNTTLISTLIGKRYNFTKSELLDLAVGTFLHDLGKIVVEKISESSNTNDTQELMKEHPTFGYLIVHNSHNASPAVCQIINQHHEHQDGSGYPLGLRGHNLPPNKTRKREKGTIYRLAEICTVADVYDNLSMNPYKRKQMTPAEAMKILIEGNGTLYNKDIVSTFSKIVPSFPVASMVRVKRLVDSSLPRSYNSFIGVVAKVNEENLNKPVIVLIRDKFNKVTPPRVIDTSKIKEVELELIL